MFRLGFTCRAGRRRAGFTLAEVTVATALLIVFGSLCVATLRYGAGLWRAGHRRSYAYDVAEGVFRNFQDDFSEALSQFWNKDADAYDPRIKFFLDDDSLNRQRIRFVRRIPDSTTNPRIRQAGDGVDNDGNHGADEEFYDLKDDDGDGLIDEDLKPLEGMCEVGYMRGLHPEDRNTLYRIVLAPIGGPESFFSGTAWPFADNIDEADELYNLTDPGAGWGVPVTENVVLHFEVRLWTQYTTTWDGPEDSIVPWPNSYQTEDRGPVLIWNSEGNDTGTTPEAIRDNVFPRAAMVILVVEPPERMRQIGRLRLLQPITDNQTTIPVQGDLPAFNDRFPYVLIRDDVNGDEWVRFESFDTTNQQFVLGTDGARGVRGTNAVAHPAGCEVTFGYTVVGVFQNPRGREYWGHTEG